VREVVKQGASASRSGPAAAGLHENEPEDVQHYSLAELRVIVEEANYARVPVAAHCECASAARDAAEAGVWSIEHGEDLDAETISPHGRQGNLPEPDLVLLTQWLEQSSAFGGPYGKPYIPGVRSRRTPGGTPAVAPRAASRPTLMMAKGAGIRIGAGSDAYCTGLTPFGLQTLTRRCTRWPRPGLSEMEAIDGRDPVRGGDPPDRGR
jgi:imidazolonepropionase-like amidohydrolase